MSIPGVPNANLLPREVWVEEGEESSAIAKRVLERLPDVARHTFPSGQPPVQVDFADGKQSLVLKRHRGAFLEHCPAGTSGLVCCNYLVVNFASNCPFDCSYCFLQDYLASSARLTAFTNVDEGLAEIEKVLRAHPEKPFRIGTGELADSLALDPLTSLSRDLVPFFARHENATLELKTKSECVDELLQIDPRGRTVVSFSLTPERIAAVEERGTASVAARLAAARRLVAAGYKIGVHFDPIIEHEGWQRNYDELIEQTFAAVDASQLAWFSLGSLRMTSSLRRRVRERPTRDNAAVLGAELVECSDGKLRVWRGLRVRMYRSLVRRIRTWAPEVALYLCMEGPQVWQRVMDEIPSDRNLGLRLAAGARW